MSLPHGFDTFETQQCSRHAPGVVMGLCASVIRDTASGERGWRARGQERSGWSRNVRVKEASSFHSGFCDGRRAVPGCKL